MAIEIVDTWVCPVHGIMFYHLRTSGETGGWRPAEAYCSQFEDATAEAHAMFPEEWRFWLPTEVIIVCQLELVHVVQLNDIEAAGTNVEGGP